MKGNAYTALGWLVWLMGKRVARRELARTRTKVGAAAVIVAIVVVGVAASRSGGEG